MKIKLLQSFAVISLSTALASQSARPSAVSYVGGDEAQFDSPVRLKSGTAFLGARRMYPSPTLYDVDGDRRLDVVIGDLPGRVTFASRQPGTGDGAGSGAVILFAAEKPLKDRSGERLVFHNW